jgi:predicted ATP-dependent endonuclease of OLD family
MYISKIRVKNYKSFLDSDEIEFKPGINLIVGQNNSGKTALLEALEMNFVNNPHKSEKTTFAQNQNVESRFSKADITLTLESDELKNIRANERFATVYLVEPNEDKSYAFDQLVENFNHSFDTGFTVAFSITKGISSYQFEPRSVKHSFYEESIGKKVDYKFVALTLSKEQKYVMQGRKEGIPNNQDIFGEIIAKDLQRKIYRFFAERVNLSVCDAGFSRNLTPNCENLAEVLQNTQNYNSWLYENFNNYVSQIYPSVKWISSIRKEEENNTGDLVQRQIIYVWNVDRKTEREDLVIPLSQCGTGIGQVLAILYLVITSKEPRTIIIDEPNSFLHPGAAKKLIQILNKFPQHQYFISTHSPEVLSAAKPSTITRLKYIDGETTAESINLEQTKDLRETLSDIGVRFSDVFFAENILWVEGPTEATAFPLILESEKELFDVAFLPLVNTGELEGKKRARKNAVLAFEIYKRLSGARALTPPFIAVVFDKEERSEQEIKELETISAGKAKFIPRRMYENYLLDGEAIAEILNEELEGGNVVNAEGVNGWIESKKANKEFLNKRFADKKNLNENEWLENVDGANLLASLFADLSGKAVEFRKTTHSVKLTEWLLANKIEKLSELKNFLAELIST